LPPGNAYILTTSLSLISPSYSLYPSLNAILH
jgi:hypothetical protein